MPGHVSVAGLGLDGLAVCSSVREATAVETITGVKTLRVGRSATTLAFESPEGHSTTVAPFLTAQNPSGLTKTTIKTL